MKTCFQSGKTEEVAVREESAHSWMEREAVDAAQESGLASAGNGGVRSLAGGGGGSEVKMPPPRTLTWADRSGEVEVSENKAGFDAQPVK